MIERDEMNRLAVFLRRHVFLPQLIILRGAVLGDEDDQGAALPDAGVDVLLGFFVRGCAVVVADRNAAIIHLFADVTDDV